MKQNQINKTEFKIRVCDNINLKKKNQILCSKFYTTFELQDLQLSEKKEKEDLRKRLQVKVRRLNKRKRWWYQRGGGFIIYRFLNIKLRFEENFGRHDSSWMVLIKNTTNNS